MFYEKVSRTPAIGSRLVHMLYDYNRRDDVCKPTATRLYEASAHFEFPFEPTHPFRALESSETFWLPSFMTRQKPEFILLTHRSTVVADTYYVLHASDEPSFSSFYIKDGRVVLLKMTLERTQPILLHSLEVLRSALGQELAPTEEKPWHFVFVVPEAIEAVFATQQVHIPDGYCARNSDDASRDWSKLVRQYVMPYDLSPELLDAETS